MKPFINFKYAPFSEKEEDRKIKEWRKKYDPDDKELTRWNIFVFTTMFICTGIANVALVYLFHEYRKQVFAFLRMLDSIPALYQFLLIVFFGAVVFVSVWLVRRGKKDRA